LPDDGFLLSPKHVARNKTDITLVVFDGLCLSFCCSYITTGCHW